ncbi:MAG: ABC transporter permease, partial [Thermoproteota archaeon]
ITNPLGVIYYLFLPLVTLIVIEGASHLLTTRAAMVSTLGEDFIMTARAKGVREGNIMFHHAARNAMIPISTRMALELALLMSGAVVVEIIFSYPGIGHLLYNATLELDYPLAEGALFIISLVTIITYSLVDFIHAWLDPRIKL